MSNGTPPPPPVPTGAPAKSGWSPWAWVAIGCGGILVVGFVGFLLAGMFVFKKGKEMVEEATGSESFQEVMQDLQENPLKTGAELAVRMNPELDLISTDDEAGTLTVRNNRTGEEATLNFEDIAEGRFSMSTDEGSYSIDASDSGEGGVTFSGPEGEARFGANADLKDVPGWVPLYPGGTDVQSTFHSSSAEGTSGAVIGKSSDKAQKVVDHYKQVFTDNGYTIGTESMTQSGGGAYGAITGELTGEGRSINVVIIEQEGESTVTVNYNAKKQ